jgi:hypothetical protein
MAMIKLLKIATADVAWVFYLYAAVFGMFLVFSQETSVADCVCFLFGGLFYLFFNIGLHKHRVGGGLLTGLALSAYVLMALMGVGFWFMPLIVFFVVLISLLIDTCACSSVLDYKGLFLHGLFVLIGTYAIWALIKFALPF